ncbi:MAG: hypothetical protein IPK71_15160 [Myxococcales bacterium]|nr:hypothetical protein [Myxococcales bacterium]
MRPDSQQCPFCGACVFAPVPAATRAHRAAIVLGVASAVLAVESCSVVAVYGASGGEWFDASRPAPRDAATAPRPPASCEQPAALLDLTAPPHFAGVCSDETLVAISDACFERKPSCNDVLAANGACAACALGPYDRSGGSASQLGAIAYDESGEVSTYACAALVIGRHDCAIPAQRAVTCVTTACASCEPSQLPSCEADARAGSCAPEIAAASSCLDLIVARRGEWLARCTGPTFRDGFLAVAHELCGAPASDGGLDAPGDAPTD